MAIHREVWRVTGSNSTAAITKNHDWATAHRVRMTDNQQVTWGACNVLRIVNNSSYDATISWTWDVARTESETLKANSVRNVNPEDGIKFYGFDVYSADTLNDIPQGAIKYKMAVVKEIPEDKVFDNGSR